MQEKLQRRLRSVEVTVLAAPRPGKKLLVLDIDYTIFDLGSSSETPERLARPHLHAFMAACYEHYDLVIWSATSMKWVEVKMRALGVLGHVDYRISFMLDFRAMVTIHTEKRGALLAAVCLPAIRRPCTLNELSPLFLQACLTVSHCASSGRSLVMRTAPTTLSCWTTCAATTS